MCGHACPPPLPHFSSSRHLLPPPLAPLPLQGVRHVMNLGHGVLPGTPEENVAHYFHVGRTAHERM